MRKYYDLLTFDKECPKFGKTLGYEKVLCTDVDVNYQELKNPKDIKAQKEKINIVKGGPFEVNKAAVRKRGVDVLLDPVNVEEHNFDTAIANIARDNGVAIGISLNLILKTQGLNRIRLFRNMRAMLALCLKAGNEIVFVSGAHDTYGMRAPLELASIGILLGLDWPKALWCVSEAPKSIVDGEK